MRMIIVSRRGPVCVWSLLLLLLAGIRSEIVPPSQYTHHNRLPYPRFARRSPKSPASYPQRRSALRKPVRSPMLRPNLTRVSCCTLYGGTGCTDPPNNRLSSTKCKRTVPLIARRSSQDIRATLFISLRRRRFGRVRFGSVRSGSTKRAEEKTRFRATRYNAAETHRQILTGDGPPGQNGRSFDLQQHPGSTQKTFASRRPRLW